MIKKVVILGGGSAGFLCAMALKIKMPDLQVRVIRSKEIAIIGVGEGSTIPLTHFLHGFLQLDMRKFVALAKPTWKLGMRFLWGPRPQFFYPLGEQIDRLIPGLPKNTAYYCDGMDLDYTTPLAALMAQGKMLPRGPDGRPAWHWNVAYHVENENFVTGLETIAQTAGVEIVEDTVDHVTQNETGVTGLVMKSGNTETADLYVDCSGFRSLLLGQTLKEPFINFKSSLFCDRAVVGGWQRTNERIQPFTTCETMNSGWAWQIEHETRINRGYVFSSDFISDEDAEKELRAKNPKVGPTRVVRFVSGRTQRAWVKNVVGIGNASGFVEPLEATSLAVIATRSQLLSEILMESQRHVQPTQVDLYNRHHATLWDGIRRFIALHYKYNERIDSEFWRHCSRSIDLAGAEQAVEYYQQCGPSTMWGNMTIGGDLDTFRLGGYLQLFVGQCVPTRVKYTPSDRERQLWQAELQKNRQIASQGFTVSETLAALRANAIRPPGV
ncbi:MAG TPA: tryptophan halogenase family protein [Tepidisphaeraceae bacterium]|nr:tryptophan halogenase family protein [Tepidisphaeraceae bacterium]